MLYTFIDEQTGFTETPRFLAASCVAVLQSRYSKKEQEIKMLLRQRKDPSFLEQLDEILSSLDGFAVIGTTRLDPQVLRSGEKDGTFDIPKMARTDNAWAHIICCTVAQTLKRLVEHSVAFSTVDLYLDRKDLKPELWDGMRETLQIRIPELHREWCDSPRSGLRSGHFFRKISIRRIERVEKSEDPQTESKFQLGTRLADAIVHKAKGPNTGLSFLEYRDFSNLLTEFLQRFDG